MISRLRGILLEKSPPQLLIDVTGVGYEVQAPMSTFYQLPNVGEEICLLTHLIVREDAHVLYGFVKPRERQLFRYLIRINGIGPKIALAILSGIEPDQFVRCVMDNNIETLIRIPGIGKKTAERLLVEMRDRLKTWLGEEEKESNSTSTGMKKFLNVVQEAVSALVALGYKPQEASKAISRVDLPNASCEELIKAALQGMV